MIFLKQNCNTFLRVVKPTSDTRHAYQILYLLLERFLSKEIAKKSKNNFKHNFDVEMRNFLK